MSTSPAERDLELATLRQGVELRRALNRLRLERAAQRVELLEQAHGQSISPAVAAAGVGGSPTHSTDSERGAAGELYAQVHVFPKGRWA